MPEFRRRARRPASAPCPEPPSPFGDGGSFVRFHLRPLAFGLGARDVARDFLLEYLRWLDAEEAPRPGAREERPPGPDRPA